VVIDAYFTTRRPGRRRALIVAALGALVVAVVAAVLVVRGREPEQRPSAAAPVGTAVAGVTPLEHGHAYDDHLNARPLQDALDHGFTSVEADVFLRDGTLVLCHRFDGDVCTDSRGARSAATSFESTYLQGLSARVNANGGRVYPGYSQPVFLFVEIKCVEGPSGCELPADPAAAAADPNNPLVVATAIMSALGPYRGMLHHVDQTARRWGPVQLVITGSHNDDQVPAGGGYDSVRGLLARQSDTYAFLDGSFALDADQYNADLVPVISFPDPTTKEDCTYDDSQSIQVVHWDHIIRAQTTGHHVRVWDPKDCPDRSHSWTEAMYASVDYLSSSHLGLLDDWLTGHSVGGGGGRCAVAHWFLGQQPGEATTVGSSTNFWWAYTRAGNGRWGWVSLVYFVDGGLDQSADGLQYGCYDVRAGESDDCHPL
jgi:hypothetical protein